MSVADLSGPKPSGLAVRLALAFGAGAASVLTLPPFSLLALVPIAWSILFACLAGLRPRRAVLVGFAFGLGNFGLGLSWIAESFYVDAERFGTLALPAVGALSTGLAVFPALAAAVFASLSRHVGAGLPAALLLTTAWTGAEWLRGHLLTGFPWNLPGYAAADFDALRQPAAWLGSYGLSFLVILTGAMPGAAWRATGRARRGAFVAAFVLPLAIWAAGTARLSGPTPSSTGISLRIVQGNIPQSEKWAPGSRERTLETYLRLSTRPGRFDVLLWPETAFPGFLDEDAAARARIADNLPEDAVVLTGAPDRVEDEGGTRYFNTIQAYDRRGEVLTGYSKHHLVPFGEYVPLRDWLPLPRMVESLGDFSPGAGPRTLALSGVPSVAPAICYEIIFPGHVIDGVYRPDWIFNATNDAWFGTTFGPEQHLTAARMRAVEEGLPVIRAANTGISAVINAHGDVVRRLDLDHAGIIDAELPPELPRTLYARGGDLVLPLLILSVWLGVVAVARIRAFGAHA